MNVRHLAFRFMLAAAAFFIGSAAAMAGESTATGPVVEKPATSTAPPRPTDETPAILSDNTRPRFDRSVSVSDRESAIDQLIASMTLSEKIGQMCQVFPDADELTPQLAAAIRAGEVGSIINVASKEVADESQRIARDESPAGIPLLVGRDVVHGYRTVFPIPLGQAASWNPDLIASAAAIAGKEARSQGINWTFSPMVDVSRDARWGRVAESLGEDPVLASVLAAAMVRGFQNESDGRIDGVAACVKHFAAYGLAEGGRDYNRASLSVADLHNVYLPPFHAAIDAGAQSLMTTFSEVNGEPGTAHRYLLGDVLRNQWQFQGLVVSDWNSVVEMVVHGFSADNAQAASQAVNAGVDMEMVSTAFRDHLAALIDQGAVSEAAIDAAVRRILRLKFAVASDASPNGVEGAGQASDPLLRPKSLELARKLARQSVVLLKNDGETLPLSRDALDRIAVVGPLADAAKSQLGCWSIDGSADDVITPLDALRDALGETAEVLYAPGVGARPFQDAEGLAQAVSIASQSDVVILVVGEDAALSGEAHSRSDLALPGAQADLVRAVADLGKPVIMIVLAGRPLAIGRECDAVDAVLYAWHPGTMGGPAIVDVLLGSEAPSGKLPVTIPKSVGQIPLYYGHPNTGRPSAESPRSWSAIAGDDFPLEQQYRSHYVDSDPNPLFPFGFGLTYTTFSYEELELGSHTIRPGQVQVVRARLTNTGERAGVETVQLYVRDLVASTVRPVRELKAFRRVFLKPGKSTVVEFLLSSDQLAYFDNQGHRTLEPGKFAVWVGGDSTATLSAEFSLVSENLETLPQREAVARSIEAKSQEAAADAAQSAEAIPGS